MNLKIYCNNSAGMRIEKVGNEKDEGEGGEGMGV